MEPSQQSPRVSWFPGHMLQASRELRSKAKLIDLVIQLLDARAPLLTLHEDLMQIFPGRPILLLLNKSDLVPAEALREWLRYFQQTQWNCVAVSCYQKESIKAVLKEIQKVAKPIQQKFRIHRPFRMVITGMPNVGKSTLINRLIGKHKAKTGPLPGVTRQTQWVSLGQDMELLDTPGIMIPSIDNEEKALIFSALGIIRDEILGVEKIASYILSRINPSQITSLTQQVSTDSSPLLSRVAYAQNFLLPGGAPDVHRCSVWIIQQFRAGKLGKIIWQNPPVIRD